MVMIDKTKVPRSIFDLEGKWLRLLELSHDGFDPETGEYLEMDKLFAELEGDVDNKIAGCGFVIMRLKKDAEMVNDEMKRLKEKKGRIDAGRQRLENRVRDFMALTSDESEGKSVKKPWISVTLSKPSKNTVSVTNPGEIPAEFMTVPVMPDPKPIVADIKKALKTGQHVPGTMLIESKRTLTIK